MMLANNVASLKCQNVNDLHVEDHLLDLGTSKFSKLINNKEKK